MHVAAGKEQRQSNSTYRSGGGHTGEVGTVWVRPWLSSLFAPQLPDPLCPSARLCL